MKVKFKKLHKDAVIPIKAHPTDFGADLTITSRHISSTSQVQAMCISIILGAMLRESHGRR